MLQHYHQLKHGLRHLRIRLGDSRRTFKSIVGEFLPKQTVKICSGFRRHLERLFRSVIHATNIKLAKVNRTTLDYCNIPLFPPLVAENWERRHIWSLASVQVAICAFYDDLLHNITERRALQNANETSSIRHSEPYSLSAQILNQVLINQNKSWKARQRTKTV